MRAEQDWEERSSSALLQTKWHYLLVWIRVSWKSPKFKIRVSNSPNNHPKPLDFDEMRNGEIGLTAKNEKDRWGLKWGTSEKRHSGRGVRVREEGDEAFGKTQRKNVGQSWPGRMGSEAKHFGGQMQWWAPHAPVTADRARWGFFNVRPGDPFLSSYFSAARFTFGRPGK
jgi:hypothetical protein